MDHYANAPGRAPGTIMMRDGRYIDPLNLTARDLEISYMLYGLPNVCRFTGSLRGATWGSLLRRAWRGVYNRTSFYSVAQHQVIGARYFLELGEWQLAREFSVHDGPEFAMGDVSRPLKYRPEMLFYREAENENYRRLAHRYGLPFPMSVEVKHLDKVMLATEARDLMGDPPWVGMPSPLRQHIEPWLPGRAFREYKSVLTELSLWEG